MSGHYLRLIREEVKSTALTQIPQQRLESIVQTIRKSYLSVHTLDKLGKDLLITLNKKNMEDVKLLVKVRFLKFMLQEQVENNSVDQYVGKLVLAALRTGETIYSPITLRYGDKILFKFNSTCIIGGKTYRRGDIALLSTLELVLAGVNECGKPLIDPFFEILVNRG
jgi:hypothetical protein